MILNILGYSFIYIFNETKDVQMSSSLVSPDLHIGYISIFLSVYVCRQDSIVNGCEEVRKFAIVILYFILNMVLNCLDDSLCFYTFAL